MIGMLTPDSLGEQGPGEIKTAEGPSARTPSTLILSFKTVMHEAPSVSSAWTRL